MSVTEPKIIVNDVSQITAESPKEPEPECSNPSTQKKKAKKTRKPQSEEEFEVQKQQFYEIGPTINTENWLYDEEALTKLYNGKKTDRVRMLHACEKAYFKREYKKCLQLVEIGETLFGIELDDEEEIQQVKIDFENSGRKTKKSAKVERHIIELMHIKERCLEKLNQNIK